MTGSFTTPVFSAVSGPLNFAREQHTATLLTNGSVLVAGGVGISEDVLSSAELLNASIPTFTLTGSLMTGRANHTAALLLNDGTVLIIGGSESTGGLSSAEIYDPGP